MTSRLVTVAAGIVSMGLLGGLAVVALTVMLVTGATPAASAPVTRCDLTGPTGSAGGLDAEQTQYARMIIGIGKQLDIPARGWVIAIATARQESGIRNLDYGDRDSLGLFQQRPSTGWGSPTQVRDPEYAIRAFYGGPTSPTPNPGLLDIPGWHNMTVWEAAQAVQRSAFPTAYAQWEDLATSLVSRLGGVEAACEPVTDGKWRLPLNAGYRLTSRFGYRSSPTTGIHELHTGLDFATHTGTPALAVAGGTVSYVGVSGGYGNLVRVHHANGVESWYAHLSATGVHVGQRVQPGTQVGEVGSTGNSTGPHLHLEIRLDGQPTDPAVWLTKKGVTP